MSNSITHRLKYKESVIRFSYGFAVIHVIKKDFITKEYF